MSAWQPLCGHHTLEAVAVDRIVVVIQHHAIIAGHIRSDQDWRRCGWHDVDPKTVQEGVVRQPRFDLGVGRFSSSKYKLFPTDVLQLSLLTKRFPSSETI